MVSNPLSITKKGRLINFLFQFFCHGREHAKEKWAIMLSIVL